jgi:methylthioribose-1-phosphate isomerase
MFDAPVWWEAEALCLLDQTALPHHVRTLRCTAWQEAAAAIRDLRVRGAPAIGVAAAYAMALAARTAGACATRAEARGVLSQAAAGLRAARPTAVNLGWAVGRMLALAEAAFAAAAPDTAPGTGGDRDPPPHDLAARLLAGAQAIARADVEGNRRMGAHGAALVPPGARVLTHCNTGMLATGGYGTAFGVLRCAHEQGRRIEVIACETRPVLQGARLTMWELGLAGIPGTLITDNAAAALMQAGSIDLVVAGADRIAANGDVANKVGTYALAVLAHAHGIPFYVAAPLSTVDMDAASGEAIPIEERPAAEVTDIAGVRIAPQGVRVRNPAFDVTPHRLVTAIVTEVGVLRPPYDAALRAAAAAAAAERREVSPGRPSRPSQR